MNVANYLAVLRVVAMWSLLWLLAVGLGLLVRRAWGARSVDAQQLTLLPWLGWGGMIGVLQVWHLSWPVDSGAFLTIVLLGVAGLLWHWRVLVHLLVEHRRQWPGLLLASMVGALWVANHAVMQPGVYDSGLYHLNGVRWAREFAIVPGLGNLHGRLAFNNSSLLFAAMLEIGPFLHRSHHLASGFLIWLLLSKCIGCAWAMWRTPINTSPSRQLLALTLAPLLAWTINSGYTSSPSPDVPVFVLGILLTGELLEFLSPKPTWLLSGPASFHQLGALGFLAMIGITVKLSFAVFGVVVGLLAYGVHLHRTRSIQASGAALIMLVGLGMLVMVPWFVRGVVLSGYLAYPSTIGRFPMDWAVPPASAIAMIERIQSWARIPNVPPESVLNTWTWLGAWLERVWRGNAFDFTMPLVTAALGIALLAWQAWRNRRVRCDTRWAALLPSFVGDVAWFLSAPDPRYQGSMLWTLGAGIFVLAVTGQGLRTRLVLTAHALLVLALFVRPLDAIRTWKDVGPARRVLMKSLTTTSGLTVFVPDQGDQPWDSDLPATPYFSPRLRLRVPDDIAQGFTKRPLSSTNERSNSATGLLP